MTKHLFGDKHWNLQCKIWTGKKKQKHLTKIIVAMLASRLRSISRRRRRWRSGAAWRRVRSATSPRYSSSTKRPRSWMLKSGRKRSVWGRTRDGSFSLTSRLDKNTWWDLAYLRYNRKRYQNIVDIVCHQHVNLQRNKHVLEKTWGFFYHLFWLQPLLLSACIGRLFLPASSTQY